MKNFKYKPGDLEKRTDRSYEIEDGLGVSEQANGKLAVSATSGDIEYGVADLDREQCLELSRLLRAFAEDGKLPEEVGDGILLCKREEVFVTMANSYDDGGRLLGVSRKLETAKSHAEDYDHEGWKGIAMSKTLHQTWKAEAGEVTLEIQKRDIDE